MSANQASFPIAVMARVLGVSESGFHAWRRRPASAHVAADAALLKRVRTIHASSRETYGAPRVHAELRAGGEKHGRKRIARLMREAGLVGASRRRGGVTTTRRDQDARPAPDLVDRNFVASGPNELWVADITFVPTASGFLYLAVVLDAWSRKVVGWAMTNHLRAELVVDALEMAVGQRRPRDVIHHSDQGSQYTSLAFGKRCKEAGVRPSMGSVGDAYDNAMCESFFATLESRVRVARPMPVHVTGGSAHGLLQLHRGLVQPGPAAFRPRLPIADGLRRSGGDSHSTTLITQAHQHSTKAGQLQGSE
jgi:putative transposase